MNNSSDSDSSDLEDLVSLAFNKLQKNDNELNDNVDLLSPSPHDSFSRTAGEHLTDTVQTSPRFTVEAEKSRKSKTPLSSKLECVLPKCDLASLCKESLDNETSESILLKPGVAKMRTLPSEQSRRQMKKDRRKEREMTKGSSWFNLPATEMTDEKKNDLMVLQMRKVLDPKRFYKGSDIRGSLPKYFQMGTVIESPADYYSSRVPKKQRKLTLVDELLNDAEFRRYNKRKYEEILTTQQSVRRSKAHRHMKRLKKNKK